MLRRGIPYKATYEAIAGKVVGSLKLLWDVAVTPFPAKPV